MESWQKAEESDKRRAELACMLTETLANAVKKMPEITHSEAIRVLLDMAVRRNASILRDEWGLED